MIFDHNFVFYFCVLLMVAFAYRYMFRDIRRGIIRDYSLWADKPWVYKENPYLFLLVLFAHICILLMVLGLGLLVVLR